MQTFFLYAIATNSPPESIVSAILEEPAVGVIKPHVRVSDDSTIPRACLNLGLAILTQVQVSDSVTLHLAQEHIVETFANGGLERWKQNAWRRNGGRLIANIDLWLQISVEVKKFQSMSVVFIRPNDIHPCMLQVRDAVYVQRPELRFARRRA